MDQEEALKVVAKMEAEEVAMAVEVDKVVETIMNGVYNINENICGKSVP